MAMWSSESMLLNSSHDRLPLANVILAIGQ